jgi:hypothetical protein
VGKRKEEKRRKNKKNVGEVRRMKSKQLRIGIKKAKQEDRSTHTRKYTKTKEKRKRDSSAYIPHIRKHTETQTKEKI